MREGYAVGTKLSKQEVITRLCELTTEVRDHLAERDGYYLASDCFCGMNTLGDEDFRIDSKVIEWIEEAIKTHKSYENDNNC